MNDANFQANGFAGEQPNGQSRTASVAQPVKETERGKVIAAVSFPGAAMPRFSPDEKYLAVVVGDVANAIEHANGD